MIRKGTPSFLRRTGGQEQEPLAAACSQGQVCTKKGLLSLLRTEEEVKNAKGKVVSYFFFSLPFDYVVAAAASSLKR